MANYEIQPTGGPGGADGLNRIAAGTQTAGTLATVFFADSNGIAFGMSDSTRVTASYTVPTVPAQFSGGLSNVGNTAGDTGAVTGRLVLAGGNNITVSGSTNGGSMTVTISAGAGGAGDGFNILAAGTQTANTNVTVLFSDANGINFGMAGSSRITASHNGLTSQSNQALSGSNGSFTFQTATFGNHGGVSFLTTNGSLAASVETSYAASNHSHGNPTLALTNLSGTTASNSAGFTLSLSAANPGGGAGVTYSDYHPYDEGVPVAGQVGQGSMHIQPLQLPAVQHDRVAFSINYSNASNSTGSITISQWIGLYTRNVSTLSLSGSTSTSQGITFSGTGGNQSLQAGPRILTIPWTTTWPAGNYWAAIVTRTTSGGANASFSQFVLSDVSSAFSGVLGEANNATKQRRLGLGHYTATTSGIPASIAFTQIQGSVNTQGRQPIFFFESGTV
jgi:hypothetical protein